MKYLDYIGDNSNAEAHVLHFSYPNYMNVLRRSFQFFQTPRGQIMNIIIKIKWLKTQIMKFQLDEQ